MRAAVWTGYGNHTGGQSVNSLEFSFNGVFPICLTMMIGFCLCRCSVMEKGTAEKLNQLAYKILIPCNLFMNMYHADLSAVLDMQLALIAVLGTSGIILAMCMLAPHVTESGAQRGEFIQGIFRGNTAILGLPLITNLYGERATAILAFPMSIMLIFYNIAAPVILSFYAGSGKTSMKTIGRKVITNPFLIGTLLGLLFSLFHLHLPTALEKTISSIGATGSTLALLALGAVTEFSEFRKSGKTSLLAACIRLIVVPAVILGIGIALGIRDERLAVLVCFFCTPTAVGSYVLAKNVTGDGKLARQILILSTVFSMPTMFLTIMLLRALGVM